MFSASFLASGFDVTLTVPSFDVISRLFVFDLGHSSLVVPTDDYAKNGGPEQVWLLCSFYHESLRTWIKTIVDKLAISNHRAFILAVRALRSYLKVISEYEHHSLPNKNVSGAKDHGKNYSEETFRKMYTSTYLWSMVLKLWPNLQKRVTTHKFWQYPPPLPPALTIPLKEVWLYFGNFYRDSLRTFKTLISSLFEDIWVSNWNWGLIKDRRSYFTIFGLKH